MYIVLVGGNMKFVHISDLHIGKRLNEYSLIEDQRYILSEIVNIVKNEKADGVLISGDVYDKSVPSAEAVSLLDSFLEELSDTKAKVFIISGNHDSAERIAYGGRAFEKQGIYISPVFEGDVSKVELSDDFGTVNVYLLPFIKPANVRRFFENSEIITYTDAVDTVIKSLDININERNVILAHQFVTGAERRDSEEISVGGIDNVDGFVFDKFDYVALGHIHKSQKIGKENMRYSGTPLKYSASEAGDVKSVTVIEFKEKGNVSINEIELKPLRDYVEIKGKLEDVIKGEDLNSFVRITLTDEDAVVDAYGKLVGKYPYMTELVFERKRKEIYSNNSFSIQKTPWEQFEDFYTIINGKELSDEQRKTVYELFEHIKEEEE